MTNGTPQKPAATIGLISETVGLDSSGKAVTGLRIPYTTAKGHEGTIFVPGTRVDKDAIMAQIKAEATARDALIGSEVT